MSGVCCYTQCCSCLKNQNVFDCGVYLCYCFFFQRVKERKVYLDHDLDDDEIEGKRNFSVEEKLNSTKYNAKFVKYVKGEGN